MKSGSKLALAAAAGLLASLPLAQLTAHHSTAEFNYAKNVVLKGTIKEVQWTNPHSYIQVMVPKAGGGIDQWGIEIGAPAINIKMGWRKSSVKAGDEVTLNVAPARNGATYGTLRTLKLNDGTTLKGVAAIVTSDANGYAIIGKQP